MIEDDFSGRQILVLVEVEKTARSAVHWAAHWALRTRDSLMFLHVIEPEQLLNFGSVHDMVRAERWQEAQKEMDPLVIEAEKITGIKPKVLLREGPLKETVRTVLQEQTNLSLMVMSANHREKGPAPFVGYLASRMGSRVQVPLVLVPDSLTPEKIEELT